MDIHHHLITLLLNGKLHLAPIGASPQRILELATGTGKWGHRYGLVYERAGTHCTTVALTAEQETSTPLLRFAHMSIPFLHHFSSRAPHSRK